MLTVCLEETRTRKLCVGLFDILMNMLKFKYCVPSLLAFCCITILCTDMCCCFLSLSIKDQSVNFLAGVFLPRPLKELAEDEQYMQENGIGDIDVIMGFNNMEGSLVLFMLHFAQLPPESLYSPQFFHTIADICLMLNQVHENQVVRKVSAYLSVFLSVSCQSVCLPACLPVFLLFSGSSSSLFFT